MARGWHWQSFFRGGPKKVVSSTALNIHLHYDSKQRNCFPDQLRDHDSGKDSGSERVNKKYDSKGKDNTGFPTPKDTDHDDDESDWGVIEAEEDEPFAEATLAIGSYLPEDAAIPQLAELPYDGCATAQVDGVVTKCSSEFSMQEKGYIDQMTASGGQGYQKDTKIQFQPSIDESVHYNNGISDMTDCDLNGTASATMHSMTLGTSSMLSTTSSYHSGFSVFCDSMPAILPYPSVSDIGATGYNTEYKSGSTDVIVSSTECLNSLDVEIPAHPLDKHEVYQFCIWDNCNKKLLWVTRRSKDEEILTQTIVCTNRADKTPCTGGCFLIDPMYPEECAENCPIPGCQSPYFPTLDHIIQHLQPPTHVCPVTGCSRSKIQYGFYSDLGVCTHKKEMHPGTFSYSNLLRT